MYMGWMDKKISSEKQTKIYDYVKYLRDVYEGSYGKKDKRVILLNQLLEYLDSV